MAARKQRASVPAEPIRRVIEKWLDERQKLIDLDYELSGWGHRNRTNPFTPLQQLAFAVWGHQESSHSTAYRVIYRLLDRRDGRAPTKHRPNGNPYRQETMSFELADLILSRLGLAYLWLFDEELKEIYFNVDLAYLDEKKPCVREAQAA